MLFSSLTFAFFLIIVFALYWFVTSRSLKLQNLFLLIASYFFYGFWDWRFLSLLVFISSVNYLTGYMIQKTKRGKGKKTWLIAGIIANAGVLIYFKYFNFFVNGFVSLFSFFGLQLQQSTLNIILPVGISFYIFLSLSYIIDIYRDKLIAEKNIINVLLTLSFFPIILAGPIQRPISLLPQIKKKRLFKYEQASDGLKQILWGLFMKIVIADNCAVYVNEIFGNFNSYSGSTRLLGGILYSVQIYSDFAGYSEIAIGVAKLFGFNLMRNFEYPYFSKDIMEFWRRWHISLTSWFRDYIFLPTAYSLSRKIPSEKVLFIKSDLVIYILGISVTWILTGLWHGSKYTFIAWGIVHGSFLTIYHILRKPRNRFLRSLKISNKNIVLTSLEHMVTLLILSLTWIIFRSDDLPRALSYISGIFSSSLFSVPEILPFTTVFFIIVLFFFERLGRNQSYAIAGVGIKWKKTLRWSFYLTLILVVYFNQNFQEQLEFIYFQF